MPVFRLSQWCSRNFLFFLDVSPCHFWKQLGCIETSGSYHTLTRHNISQQRESRKLLKLSVHLIVCILMRDELNEMVSGCNTHREMINADNILICKSGRKETYVPKLRLRRENNNTVDQEVGFEDVNWSNLSPNTFQ